MKALVAVDGSDHALHAARTLVDLAKHCSGTRAHLLNVQPHVPYTAVLGGERQAQVERWTRERGEEALRGTCEMLASAGVPYEVEVVAADAALAIVRTAVDRQCDFILMGTRGMGALMGIALGSVAAKVVQLAELPVTLVR